MVNFSSRDQPIDLVLRVILAVADDADVGTEAADFGDLVLGHQARHADHRAHAFKLCRMCQRPAMIAGGCGDDAARFLGRRKLSDGVGGAAQLEAAGRLPVLQLQKHRHAGDFAESDVERYRRRPLDLGGDPQPRGLDIGKGDRVHRLRSAWLRAASCRAVAASVDIAQSERLLAKLRGTIRSHSWLPVRRRSTGTRWKHVCMALPGERCRREPVDRDACGEDLEAGGSRPCASACVLHLAKSSSQAPGRSTRRVLRALPTQPEPPWRDADDAASAGMRPFRQPRRAASCPAGRDRLASKSASVPCPAIGLDDRAVLADRSKSVAQPCSRSPFGSRKTGETMRARTVSAFIG